MKVLLQHEITGGHPRGASMGLKAAAEGGHIETVNLLLASGADIQLLHPVYSKSGIHTLFLPKHPALEAAARGGNLQIFQILADRSGNNIIDPVPKAHNLLPQKHAILNGGCIL